MNINKQSPIPIYYQIMEQLKNQIKSGELQPDMPLPSEREYAQQFGISRMTVRQALSNLVNEGLLYRLKGRGHLCQQAKNGTSTSRADKLYRGYEKPRDDTGQQAH
nr:GntR family transcriptional regulator [Bacillus subtilis]